jgi:hypothetical protein
MAQSYPENEVTGLYACNLYMAKTLKMQNEKKSRQD